MGRGDRDGRNMALAAHPLPSLWSYTTHAHSHTHIKTRTEKIKLMMVTVYP